MRLHYQFVNSAYNREISAKRTILRGQEYGHAGRGAKGNTSTAVHKRFSANAVPAQLINMMSSQNGVQSVQKSIYRSILIGTGYYT